MGQALSFAALMQGTLFFTFIDPKAENLDADAGRIFFFIVQEVFDSLSHPLRESQWLGRRVHTQGQPFL